MPFSFESLPAKIDKAKKAHRQAQVVLGTETAEERGRKAKAAGLSEQVRALESRQRSLETSLIDAERRRVKDANKAYSDVKDGKESNKKLDIATIMADEDLKRAFAVKVHMEFKHQQEKGKSRTMLGVAGNWIKDKAIDKAKEVGDVIVTSGIYGSIGGSAAAIGAVFMSLNPWAAGLTVGAIAAILTFAAKMRATKVKVETKKDSHGH